LLGAGRAGREPEINLLLERIYFGHLNLQAIAKPNDAPRAPANQVIALRVKHIKIIRHRRERHQPAHGQAGHIHEKPKIARIRDQRGIAPRISGSELLLQKGKQLHVFAVPFGIGRIAFSGRDVIGDFLQRGSGGVAFLEQGAVDYKVGITADR
jgi:hypothetical protein